MTPSARIAAAIEILDRVLAGQPGEQALTTWGRQNRFAGSGDRRAIRDHVFDVLRRRRSLFARSGAAEETGRSLIIGLLSERGTPLDDIFSGDRFSPSPVTEAERAAFEAVDPAHWTDAVRLDYPDWLDRPLRDSLGKKLDTVMSTHRGRAPLFLRVNLLKADRAGAAERLRAEGLAVEPHPEVATALIVTENAHRLRQTASFEEGWVEPQDASSQATVDFAVEAVGAASEGRRWLDYCAGGGGKSLALAARLRAPVWAHDVSAERMNDIPLRARRAGAEVTVLKPGGAAAAGPWDVVFVDAPCSGSGAWRRQAEARWNLTPERLRELTELQASILDEAQGLLRDGGALIYVTCSILRVENEHQIASFLSRYSGWRSSSHRQWWPGTLGDGLFVAHLLR